MKKHIALLLCSVCLMQNTQGEADSLVILEKTIPELSKATLNAQDNDGDTSLHKIASGITGGATIKTFIEAGANPSIKNNYNEIALHLLAENNGIEKRSKSKHGVSLNKLIKMLLKQTSDINIPTTEGDTALHNAARSKNYQILQYLLKTKGIAPNVKNNKGETALDIVLNNIIKKENLTEENLKKYLKMARTLLINGIDINKKTKNRLSKIKQKYKEPLLPYIRQNFKFSTPAGKTQKEAQQGMREFFRQISGYLDNKLTPNNNVFDTILLGKELPKITQNKNITITFVKDAPIKKEIEEIKEHFKIKS